VSRSKDLLRLLDAVRAQGFAVRRGGSGHFVVTSPSGEVISVSATPAAGRGRVLANARAALRRTGADL
jgi:hypothetical protein